MSEKLLILKDSIDQVFASEKFTEYIECKQILNDDPQYIMYKYILNNKDKFSMKVYSNAKLKYVLKESILSNKRKELDEIFNALLKLYDE